MDIYVVHHREKHSPQISTSRWKAPLTVLLARLGLLVCWASRPTHTCLTWKEDGLQNEGERMPCSLFYIVHIPFSTSLEL
jgi:hypothetical protein